MLFNNPEEFRDEMLAGYAAAYPQYVKLVSGGVVRSNPAPKSKVTVINGGGSGLFIKN